MLREGRGDQGDRHGRLTPKEGEVKGEFSRESVTDSKEFKRWFGDWRNDPEHASKVVNEDGTPLVVYHATWAEPFTVFDRGRLGESTEANGADARFLETAKVGFWFNTQNLAEPTRRAGDRAEAVYLDIKNPYRLGSLDALADEVEQDKRNPPAALGPQGV